MLHPGEKTLGRRKQVLHRTYAAAAIMLVGFLGFLVPAGAIDVTGRIDTRYQFQAGDNAFDNDIFNYHSLQLSFSRYWTFSWYGGVIASVSDRVNTLSADGTESSDNALRTLQDAGNPGQYINYTIYSAYLKFDSGVFGATVGRCSPADYDLTRFDGLMIWIAPSAELKLEAFAGMPWHYAYTADPAASFQNWEALCQNWPSCEFAAGGGADLHSSDERLQFSLKYLFLRELTRTDGFISASPTSYMSGDSLTKLLIGIAPAPWLNMGVAASVFDASPLSIRGWAAGDIEPIHLSYSADFQTQLIGVSAVSDRLTEFAAILTASDPYVDASVDLTENLAGFFPRGGFLSDAELELTYEHRQPVSAADQSMFNPEYDQFRVTALLGAKGGWTLQAFYSLLLTSGIENTLHVVGGEIGRKWSVLDVRIGSSFNASLYQTDYTQTILEDSFYAQEYYLRVKWQVSRSFDLSLKAAYENVLLTSITSGAPLNPEVDYAYLSGLNDSGRNYVRVELRAGFRY